MDGNFVHHRAARMFRVERNTVEQYLAITQHLLSQHAILKSI